MSTALARPLRLVFGVAIALALSLAAELPKDHLSYPLAAGCHYAYYGAPLSGSWQRVECR